MLAVQKDIWHPDPETKQIVVRLAQFSNNLYNVGTYESRQEYFTSKKILTYPKVYAKAKGNENFGLLYSQAAQQTLKSVAEGFKSFRELSRLSNRGELAFRPKVPRYRKKGGLFQVVYPAQNLKALGATIRVPLGKGGQTQFGKKYLFVPLPKRLHGKQIRELRLIPKGGLWYVEYVYKQTDVADRCDLHPGRVLGIDPGLNNFATCVSTTGRSLIFSGLKLKSINQWYNRQRSRLQQIVDLQTKNPGFQTRQLIRITQKRNRQTRDFINKTARRLIQFCQDEGINTIVFGANKRQKDSIELGKKKNQEFVQLPHCKLKARVKNMCEQYGLRFIETEESYTSKASFLDNDFLHTYGEKPEQWKPTGKRIRRGLYRTGSGELVNADCNGAANIMRKVSTKFGLDLSGVGSGALIAPVRLDVLKPCA